MTRPGIALRLACLGGALAILAPVQWLALRRSARLSGRLPVLFHRLFLRLFGIRITERGKPPDNGSATLVVANHVSWLDIPVMASRLPLAFVAKSEIAGWPLIGICARLQRSIFLDRARRTATGSASAAMGDRLAAGDAIVLFPEGTTGDGRRLLPFRSALVGAARSALDATGREAVRVQPLAILYTRRGGLPIGGRDMPAVAWYGDMELAPHLAGFGRSPPLDVTLVWAEPIAFGPTTNRKAATRAAEAAVATAIRDARRYSLARPDRL